MKKKKPVRSQTQSRRESPVGNTVTKSEKKSEGNSFFSWLLVLALLGAWLSVGVVWFDLVDYNSVVGALGGVYDADGDGDFDVEDAKVLLGLTEKPVTLTSSKNALEEQELHAEFLPGENKDSPHESTPNAEPESVVKSSSTPESMTETAESTEEPALESSGEREAKKKKPKLLNKFDKTIKSEISAAEKLRKKGKVEESLRAFEALVQKFPHSPRCRYGKAQAEDDSAEKKRSNELLLKAVNTYREAADLPDAPPDLVKASLKRRADRQQFLGRTRGSLATLERLVQIFPEDISLKNDLGVAHLLLGDNKSAKRVYEEVLAAAPHDGFAKVHYGFILKSENKIAESIPYLRVILTSSTEICKHIVAVSKPCISKNATLQEVEKTHETLCC